MKNKILVFTVLILSAFSGFSINSYASADVAMLMQKMQEMENKVTDIEAKHAQELSLVKQKMNNILPVGTILISSQNSSVTMGTLETIVGNPDDRLLFCNGASVSRSKYPLLYKAIHTIFGSKDENSFNLPDFRGRFLRGVDGSAGNDPDKHSRAAMNVGGNIGNGNWVGSIQSDGVPNITGTATTEASAVGFFRSNTNNQASGPFYVGEAVTNQVGWEGKTGYRLGFDASRSSSKYGASPSEVRPKNAYVNFVIKY